MQVKIIDKFNCINYPLDKTAIEVSEQDLLQIGKTKCFDIENQCVIDYDNSEDIKKELREKRKPLLDAFDKWEKAVLRNREKDDIIVMQWFNDLLDLKETAFEEIPERIGYYIEKDEIEEKPKLNIADFMANGL